MSHEDKKSALKEIINTLRDINMKVKISNANVKNHAEQIRQQETTSNQS